MPAKDDIRVPMQARAQRTRAALVVAAQSEFSEHGYAKTTAKRIAKAAGVSTGSFYQYFTDKDAVVRELAISRFQNLAAGIVELLKGGETLADEGDILAEAQQQLRAVVTAVVEYHREDPGLHEVVTERRHNDAILDEHITKGELLLLQQIAGRIEFWWSALPGRDAHEGDALATAFVLVGMVEGAIHTHVLGHPVVDDARFEAALVGALVRVALPQL